MRRDAFDFIRAPSRIGKREREREIEKEKESFNRSIKAARANRGTVLTETSADSAINIHTSLTTKLRRCVRYECKGTRAFV